MILVWSSASNKLQILSVFQKNTETFHKNSIDYSIFNKVVYQKKHTFSFTSHPLSVEDLLISGQRSLSILLITPEVTEREQSPTMD